MGSSEKLADGQCPCCGERACGSWAQEAGYTVVRCATCGTLYVDPMPDAGTVDRAVREGEQLLGAKVVDVRARRLPAKVAYYRKRLLSIIEDVIAADKPVHWVDVGAGYGEFMEALAQVLPTGSKVEGVEPMAHKARSANEHGLTVHNRYLGPGEFQADFISNIDVFSHIPDYAAFLRTVATNLKPSGQFLMETGNTAELSERRQVPAELGLPDHLVFAGRPQLERYLSNAGFIIEEVREDRFDTVTQMAKNLIKLAIGRDSNVALPYTSPYRQLIVRARLAA